MGVEKWGSRGNRHETRRLTQLFLNSSHRAVRLFASKNQEEPVESTDEANVGVVIGQYLN